MPAHPLLRAAARVRELAGRPVVVKLGGSAMEEPAATRGTLEAVVALQAFGLQQVIVHGGGKPIDRAMAAAGLTPVKVQGRRYTDDATLEVVRDVLEELNVAIVNELTRQGGRADGVEYGEFPIRGQRLILSGSDRQPIDLGRVGVPTRVRDELLLDLLKYGFVPVLQSLAVSDDDGGWLNVNADTAASAVAGALKAAACLFLTDTPGVLQVASDRTTLIPRLTRAGCEAAIRLGDIHGGMVPKVEACFEALDAGAGAAVILDGRNPHALLDWLLGEPAGTEIVP